MTHADISQRFPDIVPDRSIRVDDEHHSFIVQEYDDGSSYTEYVYLLDKAPVDRVIRVDGTVNDREYVFEQGTDYEVVDDNGDGEVDSIDFSIGGEQPDDNTDFFVTYTAEPIIGRYADGVGTSTKTTDTKISDVIDSRQIDNATGNDLDRIGSYFGALGKRRGRDNDEYRAYLKSIVQSFSGRGTIPGLKFAIAAGIGTTTDNIIIEEDFTEVGYEIRIENVETEFLSGVVNDLAQLADPSGVELLSPPVIVLDGGEISMSGSASTITASQVGLGGQTLTMDGNSTLGG